MHLEFMTFRIPTALAALAALVANASAENPVVVMKTNLGQIKIELERDKAPITVANFLRYVEEDHYEGSIFHRVIPGFVIQGGGFALADDDGVPYQMPTHEPIMNEASLSGLQNLRGTLSMARTQDPGSATAQFFINLTDNSKFLDAGGASGKDGWAVFGKITGGLDVVDEIAATKTETATLKGFTRPGGTTHPYRDVPVEHVIIESVEVISGINKPARTEELLSGSTPDEAMRSTLGLSESLGASERLFTFHESAGNMLVEIDFGDTGTKVPIVVEATEDLEHWTPLPSLKTIPSGTSGVRTVLLPDGKKKLFLRLSEVKAEAEESSTTAPSR